MSNVDPSIDDIAGSDIFVASLADWSISAITNKSHSVKSSALR